MDEGHSALRWRLRVAGLVLFLPALPAAGATFKVSPIQIYLSAGKTTELLAVENQSSESVRLLVTAFAWNQSPRGEIELAPTEDVVFFPALLSLTQGSGEGERGVESLPVHAGAGSGWLAQPYAGKTLVTASLGYRLRTSKRRSIPDIPGSIRSQKMTS